jgi:ankyrin repeat protein
MTIYSTKPHGSIMLAISNTEILNALIDNNIQLAKELILAGKDVNARNVSGISALSMATKMGLIDIVLLLLEYGADPNKGVESKNLITEALALEETRFPFDALIQYLIEDLQELAERTALHIAAKLGYVDIAALLINYGAFVDIKDSGGCTPLHWAAISGNMEIIQLLIASGATIDIQDLAQSTPLHEAVRHRHPKVVQFLLDKGASAEISDILGLTALDLASEYPSFYHMMLFHSAVVPENITQH